MFKKSKYFKFLNNGDILIILCFLIGFSSLSINFYILFNSDIELKFKIVAGFIDIILIVGLIYTIFNFINDIVRRLEFTIRTNLVEELIEHLENSEKNLK